MCKSSRSDLILDCGLCDHVITRFALVGIRAKLQNKVISFCYFHFFSVPLSFLVFASFIFLFFVSASSKQKTKKEKKRLYFILLLSLIISVAYIYIYIYIYRERERERLDEI